MMRGPDCTRSGIPALVSDLHMQVHMRNYLAPALAACAVAQRTEIWRSGEPATAAMLDALARHVFIARTTPKLCARVTS